MKTARRWWRTVPGLVVAAALSGCATTQGGGATSASDPFEPFNRAMYAIHEPIDDNIVRPMAQAWVDYVPSPVRHVVRTFFGNIEDGFSALNGLLQGKWEKAGNDLGRITVNVWGFGLIDIATEAGIPKGDEDFGQTFGYWGIPQGPFLFVPILGPTTARDGTGLAIRLWYGPTTYMNDIALRNVLWFMGGLDLRVQALDASAMVDRAAIDKYTFIRRSYLQRREYLVHDGNPPKKEDDE